MYKRNGVWYISISGTRQSARTTIREDAKLLEHKLNKEAWDRRNGLVVPVSSVASPIVRVRQVRRLGRDRWLTVEEWYKLSAEMSDDLRDVSLLALATGLRQANVIGLRWTWLRGDWLEIPAEFTKTRKPYGIPLNRTAQGVIESSKGNKVMHAQLVFTRGGKPWNRVTLCRQLKGAVAQAGIPEFTFHGFRHTFASWLAQKGVSEAIRARLGCWSTGSQTDHYSHFDVGSLRPYAELIDSILAEMPSDAALTRHAKRQGSGRTF